MTDEHGTLILGDCLQGMRQMPPESIDLVVTDPPYQIGFHTHKRPHGHEFCKPIPGDDNPILIRDYLAECYRILKPDTAVYCFCSEQTANFFKQAASEAGFAWKNSIVWHKNGWGYGDCKCAFGFQYEMILLLNKGKAPLRQKRTGDVWSYPRVSGKAQKHQTQKPVDLIARCIEYHSEPGDTVFDGFMGAGTTAVAAIQTGRKFIGYEIQPHYYEIAVERIKEAEHDLTP